MDCRAGSTLYNFQGHHCIDYSAHGPPMICLMGQVWGVLSLCILWIYLLPDFFFWQRAPINFTIFKIDFPRCDSHSYLHGQEADLRITWSWAV